MRIRFDVHGSLSIRRSVVGVCADLSGDRLARVVFQFVGFSPLKRIADGRSKARQWVLVDGEQRDVGREFDDAIPATESLAEMLREVEPPLLVC